MFFFFFIIGIIYWWFFFVKHNKHIKKTVVSLQSVNILQVHFVSSTGNRSRAVEMGTEVCNAGRAKAASLPETWSFPEWGRPLRVSVCCGRSDLTRKDKNICYWRVLLTSDYSNLSPGFPGPKRLHLWHLKWSDHCFMITCKGWCSCKHSEVVNDGVMFKQLVFRQTERSSTMWWCKWWCIQRVINWNSSFFCHLLFDIFTNEMLSTVKLLWNQRLCIHRREQHSFTTIKTCANLPMAGIMFTVFKLAVAWRMFSGNSSPLKETRRRTSAPSDPQSK